MITLKLATASIPSIGKALWYSRILYVCKGENIRHQLWDLLSKDCLYNNIKMFSSWTFDKYVREMEKNGMLIGNRRMMASGRLTVKYYRKACKTGDG